MKTKKKKNHKRYCLKAILIVISLVTSSPFFGAVLVSSDGGMIPFHDFSVYEPGQKAIIGWNGEEEVMILSVDVYSENETKALHMVPFPTNPEFELGNISSFEKVEEIINPNKEYYGNNSILGGLTLGGDESVEIIFHEKIGPHNLTTTIVKSSKDFNIWVNNFLESNGMLEKNFSSKINDVIDYYIKQNIKYFVFDVIDLKPEKKTVDPIVYSFKSDNLFFPLQISSIIEGKTEITLVTITPDNLPISIAPIKELGFERLLEMKIEHQELKEIDNRIEKLFKGDTFLSFYNGSFNLNDLKGNIELKRIENVKWMYTNDKYFKIVGSSDINQDGTSDILIDSYDKLSLIDGSTGENLWTFKTNSKFYYSIILEDIDLNGEFKILCWDREKLYAINAENGIELWNFGGEGFDSSVLIDDLDLDGKLEVITKINNNLFVINIEDGSELWNFYVSSGFYSSFLIDDFNLDGKKELIIRTNSGLIALEGESGNKIWQSGDIMLYNLKKGDINSDGKKDILCLSKNKIFAYNGKDGTEIWSFSSNNERIKNSFILEDIDLDGKLEVIAFDNFNIFIINGKNGIEIWNKKLFNDLSYGWINSVYLADIDQNGKSEIIANTNNKIYALDEENEQWIWSYKIEDSFRTLLIDDIDSDGKLEIIYNNNNEILVLNAENGTLLWNFTTDKYIRTPQILDADFDRKPELIVYYSDEICILEGANGTESWNFSSGEKIYSYSLRDSNSNQWDIIIHSMYRIYAVNYSLGNAPKDYGIIDNSDGHDAINEKNSHETRAVFFTIIFILVLALINCLLLMERRKNY